MVQFMKRLHLRTTTHSLSENIYLTVTCHHGSLKLKGQETWVIRELFRLRTNSSNSMASICSKVRRTNSATTDLCWVECVCQRL